MITGRTLGGNSRGRRFNAQSASVRRSGFLPRAGKLRRFVESSSIQRHHLWRLPMPVMSREKVMDKVRKLIALSGSSNVHEAEVAAAAAQRLMLEHKIAESEITVAS